MTTAVLVHGGYHGGWCWQRVAEQLRAAGWTTYSPSLTGQGDRSHLLSSSLTLNLLIQDIINLIESEELNDIVLCGHSSGGMITTGVADHMPQNIRHFIALDAGIPRTGESFMDVVGHAEGLPATYRNIADRYGEGWRLPADTFNPTDFGVTDQKDASWLKRRLTDESLNIWTEPIELTGRWNAIQRKTYIRTSTFALTFGERIAQELRKDSSWITESWDVAHDVMITQPDRVAETIIREL